MEKIRKTKELCAGALICALLCASAFIRIPSPLLPITLQTLFVTLAGLLLGGKKGAFCVGVYVFMGLVGLPVFAEGGGFSYVLKPSFGYIIGFVFSALITGILAERKQNLKSFLLSSFAGMLTVYVFGLIYYYLIGTFYLGSVPRIRDLFVYCFLLTLPGDILMCIIASVSSLRIKKAIK